MPGRFVSLTESISNLLAPGTVSMKLMWRCSGAAVVFWSILGAVSEEVALFVKVASSLFCRNELVSYDSLLSVNAAVRLH